MYMKIMCLTGKYTFPIYFFLFFSFLCFFLPENKFGNKFEMRERRGETRRRRRRWRREISQSFPLNSSPPAACIYVCTWVWLSFVEGVM